MKINIEKILRPTFSNLCWADCRKGDINFLPYVIKTKSKPIDSYLNKKIYFHEVKFSVRSVEISAKNHVFPFLWKITMTALALQCTVWNVIYFYNSDFFIFNMSTSIWCSQKYIPFLFHPPLMLILSSPPPQLLEKKSSTLWPEISSPCGSQSRRTEWPTIRRTSQLID